VGSWAKDIGHLSFVDENRHLGLAHDEHTAVLNLHVGHRKTPGQRSIAVLGPLDNVDELFLNEIHQAHGFLLSVFFARHDTCLPLAADGSTSPKSRWFQAWIWSRLPNIWS
jgi:hypothetical protein